MACIPLDAKINPCVSDLYKYPVCVISVAVFMAVV